MAKIFLIGLMGVGKSYWCKKWANKLKTGHYDLDNLIELNEEATISEIFAEKGEQYFRKKEAEILRWFAEKKSFVLATGGGTASFGDNMKWMNKNGITIWLDEPVEILVGRLKQQKDHRPLIKDLQNEDLHNFLKNKLEERRTYYELSQHHLFGDEISNKNFEKIIHEHL
ncbi:MAG: shikimate kinase [Arachidicoccus sp.]|nr:shikimate kinase [Arachidicoccus sp.]